MEGQDEEKTVATVAEEHGEQGTQETQGAQKEQGAQGAQDTQREQGMQGMQGTRQKRTFWKGFFSGLVVMLLLFGIVALLCRFTGIGDALSAGWAAGPAKKAVSRDQTEEKLGKLAEIIDEYYYEPVDEAQAEEGLYDGLLSSLGDPYSVYYDAEEAEELLVSVNGSYYGIGAAMRQDLETMEVTVHHVYPGSPAEEAGLQEGDILLEADGYVAKEEELSQFVSHIKGEAGTHVKLLVLRQEDGSEKELELSVERREVQLPTVEGRMLDEKVGFVQITEFSDLTPQQFAESLADLTGQGMEALVVDLRDNPGGALEGTTGALGQILPEGSLLVYTEDKYGNRTDYEATGDQCLDLPLVVLVNGNTASASEIFAGAVQDYGRGTLIGTQTFGKGIVQSILRLGDQSAVKVTTARYFTPQGHNIHGVGIAPDVVLEYEYLGDEDGEYDPMQDNQVQKALEILQ